MKTVVVTCDSCKKLKLKCSWEQSRPFQPTCVRCQTYGLPCLLNASAWAAAAVKEVVPSFPSAPSRRLFWGASSNAGGHPLDLHKEAPPPPPQPYTQHAGFSRPLSPPPPSAMAAAVASSSSDTQPPRPKTRLLINSNMRVHLYDVFFEHIQPVVPVVTRESLVSHPPTVLLEAAILGVAARHHRSISSTRDFLHIRDVILEELKNAISFRRRYEPRIQTVQALLLILLRFELCTKTHDDLQSISLRAALACRMVQDLGFHRAFSRQVPVKPLRGGGGGGGDHERNGGLSHTDNDQADQALSQNIWAMCVYVDTALSAVMGQTPHIATFLIEELPEQLYAKAKELLSNAEDVGSSLDPEQDQDHDGTSRAADLLRARASFLHMVGLVCCLRPVLRCFFAVHPARGTALRMQAAATLRTVLEHHGRFETLEHAYSAESKCLLQLLSTNNRVLFFVGLRGALPEDAAVDGGDSACCGDGEMTQTGKRHKRNDGTKTVTSSPIPTCDGHQPLALLLAQHGSSLVDDACRILEWTTPEILHSPMGQMIIFLYATSRALMVVVDALRGVSAGTALFPPQLVVRLHSATAHAKSLMAFLLRSSSWSAFWTQGHTIKAILARLDQNDQQPPQPPQPPQSPHSPQLRYEPQSLPWNQQKQLERRPRQPPPPAAEITAAAPVVAHPYILRSDVLPAAEAAQSESASILYANLPVGESPSIYADMHMGRIHQGAPGDGGDVSSTFDSGFLLPVTGDGEEAARTDSGMADAMVNTFPSTDWDSFFLDYVQDPGWFSQPDVATETTDMYW